MWRVLFSIFMPSLTSASNMRVPSSCARPNAPTPASQMCWADSTIERDRCSALACRPASLLLDVDLLLRLARGADFDLAMIVPRAVDSGCDCARREIGRAHV